MLQWSGGAVIGYNIGEGVEGDFEPFGNYDLSGRDDVNIVACLNKNRGIEWSNLIFKIGNVSYDAMQQSRVECLQRYQRDLQLGDLKSGSPCPCSIFQVVHDQRFTKNSLNMQNSSCFHEQFPSLGGETQECCYSTLINS